MSFPYNRDDILAKIDRAEKDLIAADALKRGNVVIKKFNKESEPLDDESEFVRTCMESLYNYLKSQEILGIYYKDVYFAPIKFEED